MLYSLTLNAVREAVAVHQLTPSTLRATVDFGERRHLSLLRQVVFDVAVIEQ